jgi:DNA-binding HxlR family transcriptional regulator
MTESTESATKVESVRATNAVSAFCGVEQAARLLGDKWTLVLLRDLGAGPRHFSELENSAIGISPRTLVSRLRTLQVQGLVTRERHRGLPPRVVYELTPKGRDALPVVEALRTYGNRWLCGEFEDVTL